MFVSSHLDDSVRICHVPSMHHSDTIQCDNFGVHAARFTHSNHILCVAPRHQLDGHLHLLNVETAQFYSAMAYMDDVAGELVPQANTPVYNSIEQCPSTDVLAATLTVKGSLALFHPLVGGAIACSPDRSVVGIKPCICFSPDGSQIAVGDDKQVTIFDRRMLFEKPLAQLKTNDIFTFNTSSARCRSIDVFADHYLFSSSWGETLIYSVKERASVTNYFHNEVRRHFVGSSDAVGARYVHPYSADSCVVQPTCTLVGGRHLFLYEGATPDKEKGGLHCAVQAKDGDSPVSLSVNPRYNIVCTAARSITWWSVNI
ncbi:COMPASS component SWD2 [Angomonas deanei]|nr:COMPASS component SWD2 [Angomonas deanei]|eukprot:EPY38598.1 COMPASS component SWD2 [Angomonas deanei]